MALCNFIVVSESFYKNFEWIRKAVFSWFGTFFRVKPKMKCYTWNALVICKAKHIQNIDVVHLHMYTSEMYVWKIDFKELPEITCLTVTTTIIKL